MSKKVVEYWVYKKEKGVPYPGTMWDGPFTFTKVYVKFDESYNDFKKNQTFRIVRVTTEAMTK